MNPISHIFTSTYRVKWLKSKLTQTVKINIDENNLKKTLKDRYVNDSIHKSKMLKWFPWTELSSTFGFTLGGS